MKRFLILFASVVMVSLSIGAVVNETPNTDEVKTVKVIENALKPFTEIKVSVPAQIRVLYDSEFSIRVQGKTELKGLIDYNVNDSVLKIGKINDTENEVFEEDKLRITIFSPIDVKVTTTSDFYLTERIKSAK